MLYKKYLKAIRLDLATKSGKKGRGNWLNFHPDENFSLKSLELTGIRAEFAMEMGLRLFV